MEEDVRKPLTIMTLHESWDDFDKHTRYPFETTLRQAFEAGYKAALEDQKDAWDDGYARGKDEEVFEQIGATEIKEEEF